MGRQQYLDRLVYGRSAFEDVEPVDATTAASVAKSDEGQSTNHAQLYDARARSYNLQSAERDAELRNAQNSVLALVGAVEKHDEAEVLAIKKRKDLAAASNKILEGEHRKGQEIELRAVNAVHILMLLPAALLFRLQIGIIDPTTSFAEVLSTFWASTRGSGLLGVVGALIPGAVTMSARGSIRALLGVITKSTILRIHYYVVYKMEVRDTIRLALAETLVRFASVMMYAVEAAMIPLDYYADAQLMGLAPAYPFSSPLGSMVSRRPGSLYHAVWKSVMTFPLLGGVSAATILFFRVVLNHNANAWRPINPDLTSFHRPMNITEKSTLSYDNSDPIGRAMYMLYCIREMAMRWCGWSVQSVTDQQVCAYANALTTKPADSNGYIKVQRHRSTALALLPAQFLAGRIEVFLIRIITLPLSSLMLRVEAASYLQSSLPKTAQAIATASRVYAPFGGGPLGQVWRSNGSPSYWTTFGLYTSKLGLNLCLMAAVECAMFGCLYGIVRSVGWDEFHWGKRERPDVPTERVVSDETITEDSV